MSGTDEGPRDLLLSTEKGESDGVLVAVRDSGPGLAAETLDRLFAAFTRPRPTEWEWGCRSAARLSNPTVGDYGRAPTRRLVPSSNLRQLFVFAIEYRLATKNPAKEVRYLKGNSEGFHSWSEEEICAL